jgi:hypothetical protein
VAICPLHLIFIHLTTLIKHGEQYKSRISLCNFLHLPVTSSVLGPSFPPSTLFSDSPICFECTRIRNVPCTSTVTILSDRPSL